jgi:hypothetical protein
MVATNAQLTLAQISVNFYHGDHWNPTLSLTPDLEVASEVDGAQANNQIVLGGSCHSIRGGGNEFNFF